MDDLDNLDILFEKLKFAGRGQFVNESGFPDQLSKANSDDAGLDIKAVLKGDGIETVIYGPTGETYAVDVSDIIIPAKGRACINAMIKTKVSDGCYGRIASRSGLSKNYGIEAGAGVVDIPYRGYVSVILHNHGFNDFVVKHGMKIAQLITEKIDLDPYIEVDSLDATGRGEKGFGSSGQ